MLWGLAFGHNNANTAACNHNNNGQITVQNSSMPGEGVDPGGSDTGGDTAPTLPPKK